MLPPYRPRQAEAVVRRVRAGFPAVTLMGPRQSGKTTLVRQLCDDLPYVSLEDPDQRAFAVSDPRRWLAAYPDGAVIDEVQRVPDLLSYLQTIMDGDGRPGRWVLTGSHNLLLMERVTQSLAGRSGLLTLLPFSLQESGLPVLGPEMVDQAIWRGGYPRIHAAEVEVLFHHRAYFQSFVERDLRALLRVHDLERFETFVRLCAGRVGQILNLTSLANDAGVSATTAREWLGLLEAAFVVVRLPPWHANIGKRLIKSSKLYFVDVGLAAYLQGIEGPEQIRTHPLRGALFENLVVIDAWKQRVHAGRDPRLHFFRTATGTEIDLILPGAAGPIPVEIKSGATVNGQWFAAHGRFQALVPEAQEGALIYGGTGAQQRTGARVLDLPALAAGWQGLPGWGVDQVASS